MGYRLFHQEHRGLISEALVIAEEMTSDFFKLSSSHWLRARYDILTLEGLKGEEITSDALAVVAKYHGRPAGKSLLSSSFDFYRVCLQDHNILHLSEKCQDVSLLSLLSYILTHELVHIVRFSQFAAGFQVSAAERAREEARVDTLTRQILAPLDFLALPPGLAISEQFSLGGWGHAHL